MLTREGMPVAPAWPSFFFVSATFVLRLLEGARGAAVSAALWEGCVFAIAVMPLHLLALLPQPPILQVDSLPPS